MKLKKKKKWKKKKKKKHELRGKTPLDMNQVRICGYLPSPNARTNNPFVQWRAGRKREGGRQTDGQTDRRTDRLRQRQRDRELELENFIRIVE